MHASSLLAREAELFQDRYAGSDPWRMMVITILLERMPHERVELPLPVLFPPWPTRRTPRSMPIPCLRRVRKQAGSELARLPRHPASLTPAGPEGWGSDCPPTDGPAARGGPKRSRRLHCQGRRLEVVSSGPGQRLIHSRRPPGDGAESCHTGPLVHGARRAVSPVNLAPEPPGAPGYGADLCGLLVKAEPHLAYFFCDLGIEHLVVEELGRLRFDVDRGLLCDRIV